MQCNAPSSWDGTSAAELFRSAKTLAIKIILIRMIFSESVAIRFLFRKSIVTYAYYIQVSRNEQDGQNGAVKERGKPV